MLATLYTPYQIDLKCPNQATKRNKSKSFDSAKTKKKILQTVKLFP